MLIHFLLIEKSIDQLNCFSLVLFYKMTACLSFIIAAKLSTHSDCDSSVYQQNYLILPAN